MKEICECGKEFEQLPGCTKKLCADCRQKNYVVKLSKTSDDFMAGKWVDRQMVEYFYFMMVEFERKMSWFKDTYLAIPDNGEFVKVYDGFLSALRGFVKDIEPDLKSGALEMAIERLKNESFKVNGPELPENVKKIIAKLKEEQAKGLREKSQAL